MGWRAIPLSPPSNSTVPPPGPTALICTDFDGTLVDPEMNPPFPTELGERIEMLQREGVAWTIATGRSLFQVVQGLTQNGIGVAPDFIISSERELYGRAGINRWMPVGKWNARCAKDHRKLFRSSGRFFKRVKNHVLTATTARYVETMDEPAAIVATSNEEMDEICTFLEEQMQKVPSLGYERNTIYLRFGHTAYSKGTVVGHLAGHLGLSADLVFACGDNYNDLSMLDGQWARHVACPSNSAAPVKEAVLQAGGMVAERPAGLGVLEALDRVFPAAAIR
ncbi:hypothetical protein BH23VER1_BH23VER1_09160 [soil metagenome]